MPGEAYGPSLLGYATMVGKRWRLVLLIVAALAVPAGALSSMQPPVYNASAELVLGQQRLDRDFNAETTDLTDRQMATQMRVLTGNGVTDLAMSRGAEGTVSVSTPALSNVLIVEASGNDAQQAARTANAYAEAYIEFRTTQVQTALDDAAEQLRQRIALLQRELDPLAEQVRQTPPGQRAAVQGAVQALQNGLQEQQASLQAQLGQLQVQRALAASGASLVRRATAPVEPTSPQPVRDAALAVVLGLVLGVSAAVLLETLRLRDGDADVAVPVPSPEPARDAATTSATRTSGRFLAHPQGTRQEFPVSAMAANGSPPPQGSTPANGSSSANGNASNGNTPRHLAPRSFKGTPR